MSLCIALIEGQTRLRQHLELALVSVGGYRVKTFPSVAAFVEHAQPFDLVLFNKSLLNRYTWPARAICYGPQSHSIETPIPCVSITPLPAFAEQVRRIYQTMEHNDKVFEQIIQFTVELEKLKQVERRIKPVGLARYENSAEHSWHIALLALTLIPYAERPVDPLRIVTMLLIHDIVEIDTGDKFAYHATHDDYENEHRAAQRLFALLPETEQSRYLSLWEEFEAAETDDAQFAKAVDRLMPVLQNLHNGCQSWLQHGVTISQVLEKNKGVAKLSPRLWQYVSQRVKQTATAAGINE